MKNAKFFIPFLLISSLSFADIQVDYIKKENSSKEFRYNIILPQLKLDKNSMADINNLFEKESLTAAENTITEGKELKEAGSSAKAETIITFTEYKNSFGVTSIVTNHYSYTGGANGMSVLNSYNFNSENGKILMFDDVFTDSAKEAFEKGILQIVKNNNSGKYFSEIEKINLDDAVMYFDGDYVVFKFQQYMISPHSSGNPTFRYHKDNIKDFFKEDFSE